MLEQQERDTIWLAGILEGEGCFRVLKDKRPGRRPNLRVTLEMTDKDVVEHAARIAPQVVNKRNRRKNYKEHWQDVYSVSWSGLSAEKVMQMVLPYMGKRRTAKIIECLSTSNLSHQPFPRAKCFIDGCNMPLMVHRDIIGFCRKHADQWRGLKDLTLEQFCAKLQTNDSIGASC